MNKIKRKFDPLMKLMVTKTAINTYMVFLGNGISAFFSFVFTITAFRVMTLADFGYFSAFLSFILLVSDIADLGIGSSMSKFLPPLYKQYQKLLDFLKTAFIFQVSIILAVIVMLYILTPLLTEQIFHDKKLTWLIIVSIIGIFFALSAQFFQYALSATQKFFKVGFLSAFSSILRVLIIFPLIFFSAVSLTSIAWLHVFTFAITAVFAFFFLGYGFLKANFKRNDLIKLAKFTSFLGFARAMTALASRLDVLMLVSLAGPVEAGIYSTASRVISIYPLLAGSFSTVIAPKISTLSSNRDLKTFLNKVILGTLGIIATIFLLIVIAQPFMVTLFTPKAEGAVQVFRLLLVSMIFFVASIPSVSIAIYYLHSPQILSINSVIQILIVIIGNLFFIPKYGRQGPAISLIIAYGITLVTTTLLCLKIYKDKNDKKFHYSSLHR